MSVRKRRWVTASGQERQAFVAGFTDQNGGRHIKTFTRKKDAAAYDAGVNVAIVEGTFTADSNVTVAQAAKAWLRFVELEGRERSTLAQYRQHVRLHILPRLGRLRLARLTTPGIQAYRDRLLEETSRPLAAKILTSLKSILKDAQRRGNVAQNVASGVTIAPDRRARSKLETGVDVPTPDEISRILAGARGRWRPLLVTAVFTGLRASELRGLRWSDVDLDRHELHVRQRADRYQQIGSPKSAAGQRTVPLPPNLINTLRTWRHACPKGDLDLVFPNTKGKVEDLGNIIERGFKPAQIVGGVVTSEGRPRYTGLHCLRHFYASWCANRRADGGLELPLRIVQARLGHASIALTANRYAHLFPRQDDGGEMAAAEQALLGSVNLVSPAEPAKVVPARRQGLREVAR